MIVPPGTITRPAPIILELRLDTADFQEALDDARATLDDRFWRHRVLARPFAWQDFLNWWVARRWVVPRDVRRR